MRLFPWLPGFCSFIVLHNCVCIRFMSTVFRLDKLWGYPLIGRTILFTHPVCLADLPTSPRTAGLVHFAHLEMICLRSQVGWRYWTGQSRRPFWLVPAWASITHLPSMSQRRGGSPLPALRGSALPKIPFGHAEDLEVVRVKHEDEQTDVSQETA